jgi:3-oxoacyl-[acyl-carrier protein] reductase
MDFQGKVAIVTGASRGMGLAISQELGERGARVALVGRTPENLEAAAAQIASAGGEALAVPTDIRVGAQVEAMVEKVLERFGTVDILVNSAFWGPPASIEDTTEEFWDQTLDTCLKGAFLCARAVAPVFKRNQSGRIINIGSLAGKIGEDNRTAYCAAKWGLEGLSAALTEELTRYNIHVHLISPAATDTPWWREVGANLTPQTLERMIPAEAISQAVIWVLNQPDQVHIPDVPIYNFRNPFEGKKSPFEN